MNIRFLSVILICLIAFQANSQVWTNYTTNDVFVDSVINAIHIDTKNNIWIGTKNNGIIRFNNFEWSKHNSIYKDFGNDIRSIASESNTNNYKWFSSFGFGIIKYGEVGGNPGWTFYEYSDTVTDLTGDRIITPIIQGANLSYVYTSNLLTNDINFVIVADLNQKWFGTNGKGTIRLKGNNPPYTWWNYNITNGLANDTVNAIAHETQDNMKWFATNGGLGRYDGANWFKYNNLGMLKFYPDSPNVKWFIENPELVINDTVINFIKIDANRKKWIATNNGVYSLDSVFKHYSTSDGLISNSINRIEIDNLNNKIFISSSGVTIFNEADTSWQNLNSSNGLPSNNILCSTTDNNGVRWFGTDNGLAAYDSTSWVHYKNLPILKNNNIWASAIDNQNIKWFGTYGNGVLKYDGTNWTNYNTNNGLADSIVLSIAVDKSNNKWFGTYQNGLSKFNGSSFTNFNQYGGLASNTVFSINVDNSGNVWAGTGFGNGVSLIRGSSITNYNYQNGLAFNDVRAIVTDSIGNKWFGTYGGGVTKFNGTSWTTYDDSDGLIDNYVQALAIDTVGKLWIATRNGISSYNDIEFVNYLLGSNIWDVKVDESNIVWAGTWNEGIKKFDGNIWHTYNVKWTDSLNTLALFDNRINTISIDNGVKYFGTWSGLTILNDGGKKNYEVQQVSQLVENVITKVNVYPIPVSDELTVDYNPINANNCVVEVYDVLGKQLSSEQVLSSKTLLNFDNLERGVYMLRITDGDSKFLQKIVKN